MDKTLVINAGSSTIKWKIFDCETFEVFSEGIADRISIDGIVTTEYNGEKFSREANLKDHTDAAKEIENDLFEYKIIENIDEIKYIGFRVVQGGERYSDTIRLDEDSIKVIDGLSNLAPLHNPGAVSAMNAFGSIFPNAKKSATFDTAFHQTMPKINYTYAINKELAEKHNIRKYGMHGTSHKFITQELEKILNTDSVTFINIHMGNGCSTCAVKDSQSIDTSMGLTPLAGLMMGTRCGDIDPSIPMFISQVENISIEEVDRILNKESGLKGVSGISSDLRDIQEAISNGDENASFAYELYNEKVVENLANYHNKLGGKIDAIVFTAGVGENSSSFRKNVINGINFAKVSIDDEKNNEKFDFFKIISGEDSEIPIYVIRTNEELMIAKESFQVWK